MSIYKCFIAVSAILMFMLVGMSSQDQLCSHSLEAMNSQVRLLKLESKLQRSYLDIMQQQGEWLTTALIAYSANKTKRNNCMNGLTGTYNGARKNGRVLENNHLQTFGGYSGSQITHERFIIKFPYNMDMYRTSPILCAGIMMWDLLKYWSFI